MSDKQTRSEEINHLFAGIQHRQNDQETPPLPEEDTPFPDRLPEPETTEPRETIHVYIVREQEAGADERVVDSTPSHAGDPSTSPTHSPLPLSQEKMRCTNRTMLLVIALLCLLSASGLLIRYLYPLLFPTATITLIPVAREVTTTATIEAVPGSPTTEQIQGRLLPPLTLSQTQTVAATGKGHQDAQQARGTITFYNGLFTPQIILAGTVLTGAGGVQVLTDQRAVIPAARATTPPTYGQVTVSAHAIQAGPQGNIPVRDINIACCASSVLAQNTVAFQDGANERDYTVVKQSDIATVVASLTTTLTHSEQAALKAQMTGSEGLVSPACTPTMTSDHKAGEEATTVTVTVAETCTGIAYDHAALQEKATHLLIQDAIKQLGTNYRLIGDMRVSILHAIVTDQKRGTVYIAVKAEGIWVYHLTSTQEREITHRIAGTTKQQVLSLLSHLDGIQKATISLAGGYNDTLPQDEGRIYLVVIYPSL